MEAEEHIVHPRQAAVEEVVVDHLTMAHRRVAAAVAYLLYHRCQCQAYRQNTDAAYPSRLRAVRPQRFMDVTDRTWMVWAEVYPDLVT